MPHVMLFWILGAKNVVLYLENYSIYYLSIYWRKKRSSKTWKTIQLMVPLMQVMKQWCLIMWKKINQVNLVMICKLRTILTCELTCVSLVHKSCLMLTRSSYCIDYTFLIQYFVSVKTSLELFTEDRFFKRSKKGSSLSYNKEKRKHNVL